jgi:hypothetical protein
VKSMECRGSNFPVEIRGGGGSGLATQHDSPSAMES